MANREGDNTIRWLIRKVRQALTREMLFQDEKLKKIQRIERYPSQILVLGMVFALVALICLTVLEAAHIVIFRQWNAEIFAGIMSMVTFILGAIFGAKT
jgi:hypothetical protein